MPFSKIDALLERWAIEAGVDKGLRERVRRAVRQRHARIADVFEDFVDDLRDERRDRSLGRTLTQRLVRWAGDAWQHFVLVQLHHRVVRPALRACRRLSTFRVRNSL